VTQVLLHWSFLSKRKRPSLAKVRSNSIHLLCQVICLTYTHTFKFIPSVKFGYS
jgi:hypothetical protein